MAVADWVASREGFVGQLQDGQTARPWASAAAPAYDHDRDAAPLLDGRAAATRGHTQHARHHGLIRPDAKQLLRVS